MHRKIWLSLCSEVYSLVIKNYNLNDRALKSQEQPFQEEMSFKGNLEERYCEIKRLQELWND